MCFIIMGHINQSSMKHDYKELLKKKGDDTPRNKEGPVKDATE